MNDAATVYDLAIVGAGPAGIAAALSASEHGASVIVIDEQLQPGGQIFRQPSPEFVGAKPSFSAGYPWARALLERASVAPHITWLHQTTVFGVLRDHDDDGRPGELLQLAVNGMRGAERITARRLLIATGAYDMPVAIPGWTTPGVMMAGAVQGFIKSQKLLVAERLVLAGSHPLLIVVADQLRAAGADIAEVAFARGLPGPAEALRALPAVPGHLPLFAETGVAVAKLLAAGVRISTKTIATRVHGERTVEGVSLARVDSGWNVRGEARVVQSEALVLGYGFQASTELARQTGCTMLWNSAKGGWIVAHDASMATSVPGIYVAGEPTGVAGAEQSRSEGHLAGLAVARSLGRDAGAGISTGTGTGTGTGTSADTTSAAFASAERAIAKAQRFSTVVQSMFAPHRKALAALATPETTVCRCELVTAGHIHSVLDENPHLSSANGVKLECRSGMGPCQGRYCETTVSTILAEKRGRDHAELGYFTAHLPVKPVPLSAYTVVDGE